MFGLFSQGDLVLYVAYGLFGFAVYVIARMIFEEQEARDVSENLEDRRSRRASNALVNITRPFFNQYVVPLVRGKEMWDSRRMIYRRKLITAGLKDQLTADEFISFKFFLILVFPIILAVLKILDLLDTAWYYYAISAVIGWFYPDLWINSVIKKRKNKILRSLPFVVDLLALSTEAGLDFIGSIGKVVEKSQPSPLIDEMEQVLKELKVGSSRAEALREMSYRVDLTEMNSFIAILVSADQMGASIGKILRQQSEQIRNQRFARAERAGAAAAQKILFPLVFCIVPAVMLLIFGPFLLSFIYPPT